MSKKKLLIAFLSLLVLLALGGMVLCIVYVPFDVQMNWLATHYVSLEHWIAQNYIRAVVTFITLSSVATLLLLPVGVALCVFSGLLFGTLFGTLYLLIAYTLSGYVIFQLVRSAFGRNALKFNLEKHRHHYERFRENSFYYLLFLRIFPFTPFWLVSVLAGLSPMKLMRYTTATFLGTIFPTLIYVELGTRIHHFTLVGGSLGSYFKENSAPVMILLVISFLSLVPALLKKRSVEKS